MGRPGGSGAFGGAVGSRGLCAGGGGEEQIVKVLREVEAGAKVQEVVRRLEITETTFYRWKSKYGGLEVSDLKRLKVLEDENRKLKTLVADLTLDNQALKHLLGKER